MKFNFNLSKTKKAFIIPHEVGNEKKRLKKKFCQKKVWLQHWNWTSVSVPNTEIGFWLHTSVEAAKIESNKLIFVIVKQNTV